MYFVDAATVDGVSVDVQWELVTSVPGFKVKQMTRVEEGKVAEERLTKFRNNEHSWGVTVTEGGSAKKFGSGIEWAGEAAYAGAIASSAAAEALNTVRSHAVSETEIEWTSHCPEDKRFLFSLRYDVSGKVPGHPGKYWRSDVHHQSQRTFCSPMEAVPLCPSPSMCADAACQTCCKDSNGNYTFCPLRDENSGTPSPQSANFERLRGVACHDGSILSTNTGLTNMEACEAACAVNPECMAYRWNELNQRCFLLSKQTCREHKLNPNIDSGMKIGTL